MGRASKYEPKYHIPWAEGLLRRGATMQEVAREFGVSKSTLYEWAKRDPKLAEALRTTRDRADLAVERSLYQRALGYKATDRKTIMRHTESGELVPERVEVSERDVPPDTTAAIFWLKNRQGWSNNPAVRGGSDVPTFEFDPSARRADDEG